MIKWIPSGLLDVGNDPTSLNESSDGKNSISDAMVDATNIRLNANGLAHTRYGSHHVYPDAYGYTPSEINFTRSWFVFAGPNVYRGSTLMGAGSANAPWTSMAVNSLTSIYDVLYATNGSDKKRFSEGVLYEWGLDAPSEALGYNKSIQYRYTHDWEYSLGHVPTGYGAKVGTDKQIGNEWYVVFFPGFEHGDASALFAASPTRVILYGFEETGWSEFNKYTVRYTYTRRKSGVLEAESNPSPATYTNIGSGILASWTAPTNTEITHVRIYRSLHNQSTCYLAGEYDVSDLYATVTATDSELGASLSTDHDRLPDGVSMLCGPDYNGVCFAAVKHKLYYCSAKEPEYWPALNYIEIDSEAHPIVSMILSGGQLLVATENDLVLVQGTGINSFMPTKVNSLAGTQSKRCLVAATGAGIFHLGRDGIYRYAGLTDHRILERRFDPIFRGETVGNIPGINVDYLSSSWMTVYQDYLYFGYVRTGATTASDVLVINMGDWKVSHYKYPVGFAAAMPGRNEIGVYAIGTDKYMWRLEVPDIATDNGTSIQWSVKSKSFLSRRKHFPRTAKYDVDATAATNVSGEIILDGSVKQTHSLSGGRNRKSRLITGCNGDTLSINITGTGQASMYSVVVE